MSERWPVKSPLTFMVEFDFNLSFTIRWQLEDKNFLKIDNICLDDSLKYRIMAIKTNKNFIPFSNWSVTFRNPRGRDWIRYQASVGQSQMSRPRGRFAWWKARQGG